MHAIEFRPIGIIHSPFTQVEGMPIQPAGAQGVQGSVEVQEQYTEGLKDLEGFSHIHLIYYFHRSEGYDLQVVPFLDDQARGERSSVVQRSAYSIYIPPLHFNN